MSTVGQREKKTRQRVLKLFQDELGYTYLDNQKKVFIQSHFSPK